MKLSFGVKIRFLLLVLGCCLIATSISLSRFTTKEKLLEREAKKVQQNLLIKEEIVDNFLSNKKEIAKAKRFHLDARNALNFLTLYRTNGINLQTFQNNQLKYWSTIRISDINPQTIKKGKSVLYLSNGYYEVIKKTDKDFVLIFLIPIQSKYSVPENRYFRNDMDPLLSDSKIITIRMFTPSGVKTKHFYSN